MMLLPNQYCWPARPTPLLGLAAQAAAGVATPVGRHHMAAGPMVVPALGPMAAPVEGRMEVAAARARAVATGLGLQGSVAGPVGQGASRPPSLGPPTCRPLQMRAC